MLLTKNLYTMYEALSKFGLSSNLLQEWVDLGLVRTIEGNDGLVMLNGDDIERELDLTPSQ